MVRILSRYLLPALAVLALAVYAPQAKASQQDFSCGGSSTFACSGSISVTTSGGLITSASSTGVSGFATSSPWVLGGTSQVGDNFTLTFSTSTKAIELTDASLTLTGTITNFAGAASASGGALSFTVDWNAPGASGSSGSIDFTFNKAGATVFSADLGVGTTPEPGSLLLLGTGLLGMGAFARRRLFS